MNKELLARAHSLIRELTDILAAQPTTEDKPLHKEVPIIWAEADYYPKQGVLKVYAPREMVNLTHLQQTLGSAYNTSAGPLKVIFEKKGR